ncbi:MAG: carbohydrate-binding family 9-like protein [Rikenellaceae bacterium]
MIASKVLTPTSSDQIEKVFSQMPSLKIDNVNWPEDYPAKPEVEFSLFHDGDNLYLRYNVKEKYTLAKVSKDHGEVWTDSCVEFFIKFDESGYYNFEFTSIGKGLVSFRQSRDNAQPASESIMALIERTPTIGSEPFEEIQDTEWSLTLKIPKEAFFAHKLETLSGVNAKANFYKCGDNLTEPHFLSWNKIDMPTPNFHVPQFFGQIDFE